MFSKPPSALRNHFNLLTAVPAGHRVSLLPRDDQNIRKWGFSLAYVSNVASGVVLGSSIFGVNFMGFITTGSSRMMAAPAKIEFVPHRMTAHATPLSCPGGLEVKRLRDTVQNVNRRDKNDSVDVQGLPIGDEKRIPDDLECRAGLRFQHKDLSCLRAPPVMNEVDGTSQSYPYVVLVPKTEYDPKDAFHKHIPALLMINVFKNLDDVELVVIQPENSSATGMQHRQTNGGSYVPAVILHRAAGRQYSGASVTKWQASNTTPEPCPAGLAPSLPRSPPGWA